MFKPQPRFLLFLLLLLPLTAFASSESALDWLRKLAEAPQTLNYHGTFVYIHGGQVESMQVAHAVGDEGQRERLVHLNGDAREVVRRNDVVMCIYPEEQKVLLTDRHERSVTPFIGSEDLQHFEQLYHIDLGLGKERIANQPAQLVAMQPKDNYRYGYRFWISPEGLLLRSELIDEDGQLLEQIMFTQLNVVERVPHDMLLPKVDIKNFTWFKENQEVAPDDAILRWTVANLPEGFTKKIHRHRYSDTQQGVLVEHMLLSDGLASISVFIEQHSEQEGHPLGSYKMGALNLYSRVADDAQIVVVGDVPAATVKLVAESIVPLGQHD